MTKDNADRLVEEFLKLITDARKRLGLTHEELANRAGIHRTMIGLLERGERSPTLHLSQQLASALEISLSELIQCAEWLSQGQSVANIAIGRTEKRQSCREHIRNESALLQLTGLDGEVIRHAIDSCYHTLDTIDKQLLVRNSPPISRLVELANLSSMIGNLLGNGIAEHSGGLYIRNRPHSYPDLLPQQIPAVDLELKVALEDNLPKGHLPKPGTYITFRYVLCTESGIYTPGKESRGTTAWIWEVKVGVLQQEDFSISNTQGDSGKTAVLKSRVFNTMPLVYYAPELLPYKTRPGKNYPGFN